MPPIPGDASDGTRQMPRAPLDRLHETVDGLLARRPWLAAFACGALATLAMPPVFAWPVLFAAFYGLVRLIDGAVAGRTVRWPRLRAAFGIGWLFGFGYFVTGLYWISASLFVEPDKFLWLLPFSASLIPAGLAVFYAVAVLAAASVWQPGPARIVALALGFAGAEWLRGHVLTGLPWNMLGYALTAPPLFLQSAALAGTYVLTFFTVLLFALPAVCLEPGATVRTQRLCAILPLTTLGLLAVHGAYRLVQPQKPPVPEVRLRLVQPNVSQNMKWRYENRGSIFRNYLDLSRRNPNGEDDGLVGITHVVWPESAIPFLLLDSAEALEAVAGMLPDGTSLITGAIRVEQTQPAAGGEALRLVYNSILALDDRAQLTGVYDKLHLVPFGEYLPFQRVLEAIGLRQLTQLQGGFATGNHAERILQLPGLPAFSPLICYESIFPDGVVTRGRRPAFFLNVTNDGWFGRTAGPHQHFHQARVRAVEQGLPLIRVANTGISGVIDDRGRILQSASLGREAVIDTDLPAMGAPTLYGRFGEWLLVLVLACGAAAWFRLSRASRPVWRPLGA
jgi:apolipoprotein N-acyltransferase